MNKKLLTAGVAIITAAAVFLWIKTAPPDPSSPIVNTAAHGADAAAPAPEEDSLIIPTFSASAQNGEINFKDFCAACHGINAVGTNQGPPLIHKIYEPSHHGDFAIQNAALNGVTAHHWRFGNMPPVQGIGQAQIRWITKYLRELQAANGIN